MTKDIQNPDKEVSQESILDFEDAKEMTIGQAMRKSEELEAGVTDRDSVLDKYIKQHREEIVAGKFTRQVTEAAKSTEDDLNKMVQQASSAVLTSEEPEVEKVEETKVFTSAPLSSSELADQPTMTIDPIPVTNLEKEIEQLQEDDLALIPFYKNKRVILWGASVLLLALIGGTAYWALNNRGNSSSTTASSTVQSSSSSSTVSSSSENAKLKAFDDLYQTFFTDEQQTKLKNSSFAELDNLKKALDTLKGSSDYQEAKDKYDSLVKQVSAVQAVNSQFESPVITDGAIDTNAQVKAGATFSESNTGNSNLDGLLNSAINQARNQQTSIANGGGVANAGEAELATPATPVTPSVPASDTGNSNGLATSGRVQYGLSSQGVNLQRNLSRVPYNQAVIDDVTNPSWTFNPGVLEKILQTSRERGYITGDNYILDPVNIINGNGYYNLFKPDGTYLFSINCKTGYFVGNASGHADSLDY